MESKINYINNSDNEPRHILFYQKAVIDSYSSRKLNALEIPPFEHGIPMSRTVKKSNINRIKIITVLKTNNQEATLQAIYKENYQVEDLVFIYKLTGLNATEWRLSHNEIASISAENKVSVNNQSKFNALGEFTIGQYTNWLYSTNLWEQPQLLEDAIYNLLNFSLTGIDFSS